MSRCIHIRRRYDRRHDGRFDDRRFDRKFNRDYRVIDTGFGVPFRANSLGIEGKAQ